MILHTMLFEILKYIYSSTKLIFNFFPQDFSVAGADWQTRKQKQSVVFQVGQPAVSKCHDNASCSARETEGSRENIMSDQGAAACAEVFGVQETSYILYFPSFQEAVRSIY